MDQIKLARWLKAVAVGCAICGLLLFVGVLPRWLSRLSAEHPSFPGGPWTAFMALLAVPCYGVLVCLWRIADQIARDNSFSQANARALRHIALLSGGDAALLLVGNAVFWLAGRSLFLPAMVSAFVCFAGLAISVAAACLSHLVLKAALLQEEHNLTV